MRGSEKVQTRKAENLYRKHFAAIYSVCFLYMKNEADACDMVQETFLRLLQGHFTYEGDEKTKAWLIVTASNCCKSQLRKSWRRNIGCRCICITLRGIRVQKLQSCFIQMHLLCGAVLQRLGIYCGWSLRKRKMQEVVK